MAVHKRTQLSRAAPSRVHAPLAAAARPPPATCVCGSRDPRQKLEYGAGSFHRHLLATFPQHHRRQHPAAPRCPISSIRTDLRRGHNIEPHLVRRSARRLQPPLLRQAPDHAQRTTPRHKNRTPETLTSRAWCGASASACCCTGSVATRARADQTSAGLRAGTHSWCPTERGAGCKATHRVAGAEADPLRNLAVLLHGLGQGLLDADCTRSSAQASVRAMPTWGREGRVGMASRAAGGARQHQPAARVGTRSAAERRQHPILAVRASSGAASRGNASDAQGARARRRRNAQVLWLGILACYASSASGRTEPAEAKSREEASRFRVKSLQGQSDRSRPSCVVDL